MIPAWFNQPSTGISRAAIAAEVRTNIKQLLVDAVHDKVGHAEAVAAGRFTFRDVFNTHMGSYFGKDRSNCDHLADTVFQFIERQWSMKYPGLTPREFLDAVHVPSPLSEQEQQREIEDAWELEIMSDETSMRKHYEGSARTRKGKDLGAKRFD